MEFIRDQMNDHPEYDLKDADPEPSEILSTKKASEDKENIQPLKDSNVTGKKKTVSSKTGKPKKTAKRWLIPQMNLMTEGFLVRYI